MTAAAGNPQVQTLFNVQKAELNFAATPPHSHHRPLHSCYAVYHMFLEVEEEIDRDALFRKSNRVTCSQVFEEDEYALTTIH